MPQPDPEEEKLKSATSDAAAAEAEDEADAEPEPWTPERVSEWNAYYDIYVMLAVLLLAFVVAAVRINNSSFWTHLKAGELIAASRCAAGRLRPVLVTPSRAGGG